MMKSTMNIILNHRLPQQQQQRQLSRVLLISLFQSPPSLPVAQQQQLQRRRQYISYNNYNDLYHKHYRSITSFASSFQIKQRSNFNRRIHQPTLDDNNGKQLLLLFQYYKSTMDILLLRRSFSSNSSGGTNIQNRLRRFYKHVKVVELMDDDDCDTVNVKMKTKPTTTTTTKSPPPPPIITTSTPTTKNIDNTVLTQQQQESAVDNDTDLMIPKSPPSKLIDLSSMKTSSNVGTEQPTNNDNSNNNTKMKWYTITLDDKILRTPRGQMIRIPSKTLAYILASEWNMNTMYIIPHQMPIMTYICTVLDQVQYHRTQYISYIQQYITTDTLCYTVDPIQDIQLFTQQRTTWLPIKQWIQYDFCYTASNSHNSHSNTNTKSITDTEKTDTVVTAEYEEYTLPEELLASNSNKRITKNSKTKKNDDNNTTVSSSFVKKINYHPNLLVHIQNYISNLDHWHLTILYIATKECKSFWFAIALLYYNNNVNNSSTSSMNSSSSKYKFDTEYIQKGIRLEEEHNIQECGFVEGQHDYDRLNCSIQLRTLALIVQSLLLK